MSICYIAYTCKHSYITWVQSVDILKDIDQLVEVQNIDIDVPIEEQNIIDLPIAVEPVEAQNNQTYLLQ